MTDSVAKAEGVSVRYGDVHAASDVSFDVRPGEAVAVIGPNGSGKTTTIECLEGLRRPDEGSVRVFGMDPWTHRKEVYRRLGVQLQQTEYPDSIRVIEECRLFASFYDRPADWAGLLRQLGLWEKRARPVMRLSGGERQKLSIILALMGRPDLLILDEITTGLDPEARRTMRQCLADIKKNGVAVLFVSHYLDDVEALADRIVFLQDGKSRFFGTPEAFRDYATKLLPDENVEDLPLEDIYLRLAPESEHISMEDVI